MEKEYCQKKLTKIEDENNVINEILEIIKKNNLTFENFKEVIPKIELFFKNNATI
ncbi:MAG: hypothetical protein ABF991_12575 [Liquorilactobacillus hordei]|uniref:hypothetical protein n=1 Tax=Liquorilactobacillus hordei TaxID=468911 RepID=UPI0039E9490A